MTKITGRISEIIPSVKMNISAEQSIIRTTITGAGPQGPEGPAGTTDYLKLENLPSIESVELLGDKTFEDFGLLPMTLEEIENLL